MVYKILKSVAITTGVSLCLFGCSKNASAVQATNNPSTAQTQVNKPNIVLIIADDFGVDASPCYNIGTEKPDMPNLERLCQSGVVFDNAWVNPVCTPTRSTILTGKYGFRTNVRAVDDLLSTSETSLQRVLGAAGYATAVVGKWHVAGATPDPNHPSQMGVGFYSGFMSGSVSDYFKWSGVEQGQTFQSTTYTTTAFTNKALEWASAQTQPFFLWVAYNAPHTPFHVPPANLVQTTLSNRASNIRNNPRPYYFAMLEALDAEIGRLLTNLPQNTVVAFIGDNGSPSQVIQAPFSSATAKGTVTQGGVHVPMVVAGPDVIARREDDLVNGADLFATIAELGGANASTGVDSLSFVPALRGNFTGRQYAYTEVAPNTQSGTTKTSTQAAAIRDLQYKLVRDLKTNTDSLYDIRADPGETQNIATQQPQILSRLQAQLQALLSSSGSKGVLWP
jgi:arylsulfatase A-like enzyme